MYCPYTVSVGVDLPVSLSVQARWLGLLRCRTLRWVALRFVAVPLRGAVFPPETPCFLFVPVGACERYAVLVWWRVTAGKKKSEQTGWPDLSSSDPPTRPLVGLWRNPLI